MLLALDAGNTNVTVGLFEGAEIKAHWRLRTVHDRTPDEWGLKLRGLFALEGIEPERVSGIMVASVVPPVDGALAEMSRRYFQREAEFIGPKTDTGMEVLIDNPRELGADRIVNGVAAYRKYGGPCVVVDLGTAITFDAVSAEGAYLGGVIAPGIGIAIMGLFSKTARLPMVDFREPEKLIGTNTVGNMQSGLYYGTIGMIDGILERIKEELGAETKMVATGGQSPLIVRGSRYLKLADEDLTLEGLRMIWERTRGR